MNKNISITDIFKNMRYVMNANLEGKSLDDIIRGYPYDTYTESELVDIIPDILNTQRLVIGDIRISEIKRFNRLINKPVEECPITDVERSIRDLKDEVVILKQRATITQANLCGIYEIVDELCLNLDKLIDKYER